MVHSVHLHSERQNADVCRCSVLPADQHQSKQADAAEPALTNLPELYSVLWMTHRLDLESSQGACRLQVAACSCSDSREIKRRYLRALLVSLAQSRLEGVVKPLRSIRLSNYEPC